MCDLCVPLPVRPGSGSVLVFLSPDVPGLCPRDSSLVIAPSWRETGSPNDSAVSPVLPIYLDRFTRSPSPCRKDPLSGRFRSGPVKVPETSAWYTNTHSALSLPLLTPRTESGDSWFSNTDSDPLPRPHPTVHALLSRSSCSTVWKDRSRRSHRLRAGVLECSVDLLTDGPRLGTESRSGQSLCVGSNPSVPRGRLEGIEVP